MNKLIFIITAASLSSVSCSTLNKSLMTGGASGAATGALLGQAAGKDSKGTAIGAAVGLGVGTLLGYLGHKDKKRKLLKSKINSGSKNTILKKEENTLPYLTKPKIRTIWVPDKIEGRKYIKGHFIHLIEDNGSWSLDD